MGGGAELPKELANYLLRLARLSIGQRLGVEREPACMDPGFSSELEKPAATFVTLKIEGNLRGCIGNLEPHESLADSIKSNGVSAAFHDRRFSPLTENELKKVKLEISVLSTPVALTYEDAKELGEQLRPGVDGVVLRQGGKGATFLPQVWEQLPTVELFLSHLCKKAGLDRDCWLVDHPDILIYQVQSFSEDDK